MWRNYGGSPVAEGPQLLEGGRRGLLGIRVENDDVLPLDAGLQPRNQCDPSSPCILAKPSARNHFFMTRQCQHTEVQLCCGIDEHLGGMGQIIARIISRMGMKVRL